MKKALADAIRFSRTDTAIIEEFVVGVELFANAVKSIAPTIGVCLFGYLIGALFKDLNVAEDFACNHKSIQHSGVNRTFAYVL